MEEAKQARERLSRIDPVFNPPGELGVYYYLMDGQYERALKTFKSPPSDWLRRVFEIWLLAINQRPKEALEKINKFVVDVAELGPDMDFGRDCVLFFKYSLLGKKEQALAYATEKLKNICQTDEQLSWMLADCYALIGEKEEAIRWLENAVNRGFVNYPYISQYNRFLKNIRGEPRFKKLLERVKYEWEHFEV